MSRSPRLFLSRRSLGEGGCSMCGPHSCSIKITEEVRKNGVEQGMSDYQALRTGMEQKSKDFAEARSEICSKG